MNLVILYEKNFTYHDYYKKSFEKLTSKGINVFIFGKNFLDTKLYNKIYKLGYTSKKDLMKKLEKIYANNTFFHTFEEHAIPLVNEIKKHFSQSYTTHYLAFTNKDLQRKLLLNYDKTITVNFVETTLEGLNFNFGFDFPVVIKPVHSAQSRGVKIVRNKEELENYIKEYKNILQRIGTSAGYLNEKFLIEEFIDGTAWSIDYFVDSKQNIYLAKPVFLEFGIDIGIDDFCNISRVISYDTDKALDLNKLKDFIEKNVKALDIKNTFVHHEFKLISKGTFKTIELNGRIGGFRLDMYDKTYNLNLLELPFENYKPGFLDNEILTNYAVWAIYPDKKGILNGFNQELIGQIEKLPSLDGIRILSKYLGKEIGPAKEGFSKIGTIRLKNKELEQFKKDYEFIRKNYKKLIILH